MIKRRAVIPTSLAAFHAKVSKATLHEALLDLWSEHNGLDQHPASLSESQLCGYREDVERRSALCRNQGKA